MTIQLYDKKIFTLKYLPLCLVLKGFKKISVLQGESKKIEIKIGVSKLAFYDEKKSDWNIEKGEYIVYVGNASDNISKELKITII